MQLPWKMLAGKAWSWIERRVVPLVQEEVAREVARKLDERRPEEPR